MILQCTNCGGSVTANDQAILRGVVTCDYCHTALRVTKSGIETYKKRLLNRRPPKGIKIKHRKTETKLIVPMQQEGAPISGPIVGKRAWLLYGGPLAAGLLSCSVFGFDVLSYQLTCSVMLFVFLGLLFTLAPKPFILLRDGILQVPYAFSREKLKTPFIHIKQLYVTVNQLGGKSPRTQYNLFALKKDGTRVRLYSNFASLEAALYVEEWLEIELDIFDLPVYGDLETGTAEVVAFQAQPDEQMICYVCTAPLHITTAVRQQGYLTCAYCHTITLLYTDDSHKLILGQPQPEKMAHRLLVRGQFAGVLQKKDRQASLLLSGNKISGARFNRTLTGKTVKRFGIREIFVPRELGVKDWLSGEVMSQYEQALAYSHDAGLRNRPLDMVDYAFNSVQYMLLGQIETKMYPLIPAIEDLQEAAFIVVTLNDFLESVGSESVKS